MQGILTAVICGEQKLMAVARDMRDGVVRAPTISRACVQQLVRLHAVHGDCQLTLIALNRHHGCSELVDDLANCSSGVWALGVVEDMVEKGWERVGMVRHQ
jgi:hypothetical protein